MKADGADFGLQAHLDHLYATQPRRMALRADTRAAFRRWQEELRGEIVRLLGLAGRPPLPPLARDSNYVQALTFWYQTDLRLLPEKIQAQMVARTQKIPADRDDQTRARVAAIMPTYEGSAVARGRQLYRPKA